MNSVVPIISYLHYYTYQVPIIIIDSEKQESCGFLILARVLSALTSASGFLVFLEVSISLPFVRPVLLYEYYCAAGPLIRNRGFGFRLNFVFF